MLVIVEVRFFKVYLALLHYVPNGLRPDGADFFHIREELRNIVVGFVVRGDRWSG